MNDLTYTITAVERDTGLSKDVLRMWERRYGFPTPQRDANGERLYPAEQVERLRLIKRLMDQGHRPGRLMQASPEDLARLAPRRVAPGPEARKSSLESLLGLIKRHDTQGYQQQMQQQLARDGLLRFVQDTIAPLTERIGEAWMEGEIQVFEEHLYTEQTKRLLRQMIAGLPPAGGRPRILLTTPPEEQHSMGLLMAEALFSLEGATCIPLGTQTPLADILRATETQAIDVVALSFSAAFPTRQITPLLAHLRQLLPATVGLWAGGSAVRRLTTPAGVCLTPTLTEALDALAKWRSEEN